MNKHILAAIQAQFGKTSMKLGVNLSGVKHLG